MTRERLQVWFESPEALRSEFEKNIVNGGIFVETEEFFDVRQQVSVDIELTYAEGEESALSLDADVVHVIPVEMTSSGARPGVALQFEANAATLRDFFAPLLGQQAIEEVEQDTEGARRRSARRGDVRVPVRVMPTMSPPFEATSRDLSLSGILISLRNNTLPIGEVVRICLWHPSGDPSVEIDAKIVREVKNQNGRIAAVAAAFDRKQAADPRVCEVIESLNQAGHRNRLGGISGSLAELGLANILEMFGSSAPQGTLVVEHDGEQGWVAFAEGALLAAEVGGLNGQDALVEMLDWGDGCFNFEASVAAELLEVTERRALSGAVLEAVCTLDEREHDRTRSGLGDDEEAIEISPVSTFSVDPSQEVLARSGLSKTEDAVLELAKTGIEVGKLMSIIPEPAAEIRTALESLIEQGVLVPR